MKLSIIICVYNTATDLFEKCLKSITESTLFSEKSHTDAEIIMIDDGSNTDYSDLIDRYGLKCTRTENRGIFEARALGVSLAEGDYVAFVDSDDTVSFNYHLPMLRLASERGADIVINDWAYHTDSSRYYTDRDSTIINDICLTDGEIVNAFLKQSGREHSYYVLWNKMYKRSLISEATKKALTAARDIERYNYSEDVLINFYAFLNAKKVQNLHTGYYFYRIHPTQSVSVTSEEKLKKQIDLISFTLSVMEEEIALLQNSSTLVGYLREWRKFIARAHYTHARSGGFKTLYPYIKKTYDVDRLKKSTYLDEICGMRCVPLPDNFIEIDAIFNKAWNLGVIPVSETHKFEYVDRTVDYFAECGLYKNESSLALPNPKIPLKKKIRFNPTLMRIARVLFPKGSRIRAFLKRHM